MAAEPHLHSVMAAMPDEQGGEKCVSLEKDRKKKQDRRGLTRKLLEDLEGILPSGGSSMRRTLHRILEDCVEEVKSTRSSSVSSVQNSQMPPGLWKEGLSSSTSLGVGTLNLQFCFTECNAGLSNFVGMDSSSIIGRDLFSLFQPQDGMRMMQRLNREMSNGLAVQETARLINGDVLNVVVTKAGSQPSTFCVLMCKDLGQDASTALDACGQKRARSEVMGIHDLESAVSSALKRMNPSPLVDNQGAEKAKPDISYHPYLHGLKNFGNSSALNLFNAQPNVASSPLFNQPNMPSFAPNLSQLPSNSALAQYVQALSANQTPSLPFGLMSSSSEPAALQQLVPPPPQRTLPSVSSLNLPLPFLPDNPPAPSLSTPALQPAGAPPTWAPAAPVASEEAGAASPAGEEVASSGSSYKQQLKLQEQVQWQYKQLSDLTRQLSTMQELISKHIPALTPAARALVPHEAAPESEEGSKAGGEGKEEDKDKEEREDKETAKDKGKAKSKGERVPRKMPSTRNATVRWSREEHLSFLQGLERLGTGQWSSISKYYVPTRTPAQVASHHQKFAIRSNMPAEWRQKPSILDITTPPVQKLMVTEG